MTIHWRFASLLLVLFSVTGCVATITPYPAEWPPLKTAGPSPCPDLTGTYPDESVPPQRQPACSLGGRGNFCESLSQKLVGLYRTGWTAKTIHPKLRLEGPSDDMLQLAFIDDNGRESRKVLHAAAGEFSCQEGAVIITTPGEAMAGGGAIGMNTGSRREFRRSSDGALVMRESSIIAGIVFLVIPVLDRPMSWWKWLPVK